MPFEWDERKAELNLRKHGVDFSDAILVFDDADSIEREDDRYLYTERRFQVIGKVNGVILFVAYAERNGDVIRIISARKAERHERKRYEDGDF